MSVFWGNRKGSKRHKASDGDNAAAVNPISKLVRVHQNALLEVDENKYECRVHDFTTDVITLTAPTDAQSHPIIIRAGTEVRVILQTNDGFQGFNTQVVEPKVVNNIPLLDVYQPTQVERTDRREYYRVPVDLFMEYRLPGTETFQVGRVVNISGGGLLCLLARNVMLEKGVELTVRLHLPTAPATIEVQAVVRKLFDPLPRAENRQVAGEFVNLPPRVREAVIRYVAHRQLELIRAGVLQK